MMMAKRTGLLFGTALGAFVCALLIVLSQSLFRMRLNYEWDDFLDTMENSVYRRLRQHQRERTLIMYAYSESDYARDNLAFFIDQGLHDAADFIFIFNGPTDMTKRVPQGKANIKIVERENTCFDLGAFGLVLKENDLWKGYKRFITLNASIKGPFVPLWSDRCWSDAYIDNVTNETKLVGISANCAINPHIQSMLWATDSTGMELMLSPPPNPENGEPWGVGYSTCHTDFQDAVTAEVWTTEMIRRSGYYVKALMASFSATSSEQFFAECADHSTDPWLNDGYFGTNIHPYEAFFYKTHRGIDPPLLDLMTRLHSGEQSKNRAYDLCK